MAKKQKTILLVFFILLVLILIFIFTKEKESTKEEYLGYKETKVEIKTKEQMTEVMFSFAKNIKELNRLDKQLYQAASEEDVDKFFNQYRLFNEKSGELLSQAQGMALFEQGEKLLSFKIISPVFAKKRSSFWYYVPIFGSLLKAKHKSIETSRAGVYHYLRDKLDPVDRKAKLKEYGFDNIEELRNASDDSVEKIARDPELRSGIDWKKVTNDLGETAVNTVVEANKSVLGGDFKPVKGTVDNIKKDILDDGKMQNMTIEDEMEDEEKSGKVVVRAAEQKQIEKRVTLGVRDSAKKMLESAAVDTLEEKWSDIKPKEQEKITKRVVKHSKKGPVMMVHESEEQEHEFNISPGKWSFSTVAFGGIPVNIEGVDIKEGEIKEINEKGYIEKNKNTEVSQEQKKEEKETAKEPNIKTQEKNDSENKEEELALEEKPELKEETKEIGEIEAKGEKVQANGSFDMHGVEGPVEIDLYPEGGPLSGTMITPLGEAMLNGTIDHSGKAYAGVSGSFQHPDPDTGIKVSCNLDGELNGQVSGQTLSGNFNATCATDNYSGTWSVSW